MDNQTRIQNLPEEKYQVLFGVRKTTFDAMLAILENAYKEMRKKGGRKRMLSVLDMLIITLGYYHDYRTMENMAFDYNVHKQRICEAIAWVEQTLIKNGIFSLPSKRELLKNDTEIVIAIVDATECETERPQKKQKESYSGKQKCHTIKDLLVINGITGEVICIEEGKGSIHDFELFKQSGIHIVDDILLVGDKGFQSICAIHPFSLTPYKQPRKGTLTPEQKAFNSSLSKFRILIEHVNRRIKRFKMMQIRYRNKQRKHLLRISLICGIHNFELRL
jgi:hypothetical protein